jgi:hypothetical protein
LWIAFANHFFPHCFGGDDFENGLGRASRRIKKMRSFLHDTIRKAMKLTACQNLAEAPRVARFKSADAPDDKGATKPAAVDISCAFATLQKKQSHPMLPPGTAH